MRDEAVDRSNHGIADKPARPHLIGVIVRCGLPTMLWTIIVIAGPLFINQIRNHDRAIQEDFALYYFTSRELRDGINPYTTDLTGDAQASGLKIHAISHSNEPPTFLAVLMRPLTHLPIRRAYSIWQIANVICFVIAMVLLLGPDTGLAVWQAMTLAALATLDPAVAAVFWFGQSKLIALVLLVITMRLIEKQRPQLAGFTLASVAMLRGFPFVLAAYLLLQRRWRVLLAAIAGVALIGIVTIWIAGVSMCLRFVSALPTVYVDPWNSMHRDFSIYFVISRQTWAISRNPGPALDLLRHLLIAGVDLSVLAATCRATLVVPERQDPDSRIFALWVATAIFLLPVAWDHDLTLMLIPFAQLAVVAARGAASRRAIAMAVLSYASLFWWEYVAHSANELGFGAMLTAYLSAYWLAVDQPGAVRLPMHAIPSEIWRRLMPAP
jgi:glycosyl transferase family 87